MSAFSSSTPTPTKGAAGSGSSAPARAGKPGQEEFITCQCCVGEKARASPDVGVASICLGSTHCEDCGKVLVNEHGKWAVSGGSSASGKHPESKVARMLTMKHTLTLKKV